MRYLNLEKILYVIVLILRIILLVLSIMTIIYNSNKLRKEFIILEIIKNGVISGDSYW